MAEGDQPDHAAKARMEVDRGSRAEASQLIGRDRELAQLARHFPEWTDTAPPVLVVVSGPTGMGKSSLLERAREIASVRGWRVAPDEKADALSITPATTEDALCVRIRSLLGIHVIAQEAFVGPRETSGMVEVATPLPSAATSAGEVTVTSPVFAHVAALGAGDVAAEVGREPEPHPTFNLDPAPNSGGVLSWLLQELVPAIGRSVLGHEAVSRFGEVWRKHKEATLACGQGAQRALHQLANQLARQAPTVLIIEGYRPSVTLASSFETILLTGIRRVAAPVVLVVADEPSNVAALVSMADETIVLGPLDANAVRQHFQRLEVEPPIEEAELARYVEEASTRPKLLWSLTRVLQLVKTTGQ